MNKKAFFSWLMVAAMIAATGCGNGTPTEPTSTEGPGPTAPIEGDLQQIIAYTFPDGAFAIKAAPFVEIEEYTYELPDWWVAESIPTPFAIGKVEIGNGPEEQGVYVVAIDIVSEEETVSGLLASTTDADIYRLFFQRVPQMVNPARGEGATIEEFKALDAAPAIAVGIRADSVCFVVKTDDTPTYFRYCSISSESDEPTFLLSVRDNFDSQYLDVQKSIDSALEILIGTGQWESDVELQTDQIISEMEHPGHLENCANQILNPAQAIQPEEPTATEVPTTLEFDPPEAPSIPDQPKPSLEFSQGETLLPENLEALQKVCGSDITVAPVTLDYFNGKYESLPTPTSSQLVMASILASAFKQANPTPITVAVVKILQPIATSLGTVFPGNYRLDYWFNAGGEFYAATITGALTNGTPVTNQPVPAVPATFVNPDGTEQGGAQISTCRIFGRCTFFQSSCS